MALPELPIGISYGTKPRPKRRQLLVTLEDGKRTGRVKSPTIWTYELVFTRRTIAEYETLVQFWDTMGYSTPFTYVDPIRQTTHTVYFDGELESNGYTSFNDIDFNVTVTE